MRTVAIVEKLVSDIGSLLCTTIAIVISLVVRQGEPFNDT